MQRSAPEALDLAGETPATRALYGLEDPTTADYGRRCLLARRLLERGVRFVQVWSGAGGATNNWDNHNDIPNQLPPMARSVDRPIAALLRDLKARGLMEDTLVVFSTEFGRQPFTQGATGRDHNGGTSIAWLAGAGIKGGAAHGESDPWAWRAATGQTYCYDLHATILHLMGIDHTQAHVPPQRHRPPPDRCSWARGRRDPGVTAAPKSLDVHAILRDRDDRIAPRLAVIRTVEIAAHDVLETGWRRSVDHEVQCPGLERERLASESRSRCRSPCCTSPSAT